MNGEARKLRILWHGVPAEYGTGYGTQTNLFTRYLAGRGHKVTISSIVPDVRRMDRNGIPVLPPGPRCLNGNDMVIGHYTEARAQVVVSCMDTHVMDTAKFEKLNWLAWQVVDSEPMGNHLKKAADAAKVRIAMSKFGQRVLQEAGYSTTYVPLAIDRKDFNPGTKNDRIEARAWMSKMTGMDPLTNNDVLVVMNSANMSNPSRKNFYAAMVGFEEFRKNQMRHALRRAVLYIHTEPTGQIYGGEDIIAIAEQIGIPIKSLYFPPQYPYITGKIGTDQLVKVYRAADVFLHTASGEGFGIPIVEAMACGCPVIIPNHSAMVEFQTQADKNLVLCDGVRFCSSAGTTQVLTDAVEVESRLSLITWGDYYSSTARAERVAKAGEYDISKVGPMLETLIKSMVSTKKFTASFPFTVGAIPGMEKVKIINSGTFL